jgi:FMN reductase
MESGIARAIRDESWSSYQHEFGSSAEPQRDVNDEPAVNLDTDLMRLAAGGSTRPNRAR